MKWQLNLHGNKTEECTMQVGRMVKDPLVSNGGAEN